MILNVDHLVVVYWARLMILN